METHAKIWLSKLKFFTGVFLVIFNFILGKIALPVIAIDPDLSLWIYLISWLMLIVGAVMCGKEGWYLSIELYKKYERRIIAWFKASARHVKPITLWSGKMIHPLRRK